ncbi:hypothetical protein DH2020_007565 [Rehmannia glutinosa]|uniref:Beta-galactosidase n=1 Tax=Rehmannia glutinosa TaxID=99300 RepID=A0ABR0TYJ8_REHGL
MDIQQISFFSTSDSLTFRKSCSSPPFPRLIQSKILYIGKSRVTKLEFAESGGRDEDGSVAAADEAVVEEEAEGGGGCGGGGRDLFVGGGVLHDLLELRADFLIFSRIRVIKCSVTYDKKAIIINGQRKILLSGSIHYPRSTPDMWEDLILKAKNGGLDVIDTYVFWNGHEPSPGNAAMQQFTEKIVGMMKSEKLFESQGGPIILSQIENEYGAQRRALGAAGDAYMNWAAKMAVGLDTGVPWVMCKDDNAPDPVINTCNGFYCDAFSPNKPYKPSMWTEAWSGWEPKYGHLKELHKAIKLCEHALVSSDPNVTSLGNSQQAYVFSSGQGNCAAFLSNFDSNSAVRVMFNNMHYNLPPWSVSILPDCRNVVFNTAKDTTLIEESSTFTAIGLLEQINVTRDNSDYLWYTTSIDIGSSESFLRGGQKPILTVNSKGHAIHVFINGQLAGSAYGTRMNTRFTFTGPVNLQVGKNKISLLSIAMGLPNNGLHFENWNVGLGLVQLGGLDQGKRDLSKQTWSYQAGLKGEKMNLVSPDKISSVEWTQVSAITQNQQPLRWYKAYFDSPGGNDPLALDMRSMGKGQVWINGQSIGRYWLANANGNCGVCHYTGAYRAPKCQRGCSQPTQRWYHVPRSWLQPTQNLIVVFEELGGDASKISLVKRTTSGICANAFEHNPMVANYQIESTTSTQKMLHQAKVHLRCAPGQSISTIKFASFGTPKGTCGSFQLGNCHAQSSHAMCLGKESCKLAVSNSYFGSDPCPHLLVMLTMKHHHQWTSERKVNMFLRVNSHHERWYIDHLSSNPDVPLPDEHTSMVNRLGHSSLEYKSLKTAFKKVLHSEGQHIHQNTYSSCGEGPHLQRYVWDLSHQRLK